MPNYGSKTAIGEQVDHLASKGYVDESGTYWLKYGKNTFCMGATKPAWYEADEKIQKILNNSDNPKAVKDTFNLIFDNTFKESSKHKPYDGEAVAKSVTDSLKGVKDKNTLGSLKDIFKIKFNLEQKSCEHMGSMPSSQCYTMKNLGNIIDGINNKARHIDAPAFVEPVVKAPARKSMGELLLDKVNAIKAKTFGQINENPPKSFGKINLNPPNNMEYVPSKSKLNVVRRPNLSPMPVNYAKVQPTRTIMASMAKIPARVVSAVKI